MANIVGGNIHVLTNSVANNYASNGNIASLVASSNVQSVVKMEAYKKEKKKNETEKKIPDVEKTFHLSGEHLDDKLDDKTSDHLNDHQEYEYDDKNHLLHINLNA